ncbi:uncharacterized protein DS421_13g405340 [Arachis hypogaea]|nr:uncharacterized protein DS421_13g405340 [Arachis hypogaea]
MKPMESNRETNILDVFAKGFELAVTQAKFLAPDGDFTAMDLSKVVQDRLLEDDEEAAEEGDDNLAD